MSTKISAQESIQNDPTLRAIAEALEEIGHRSQSFVGDGVPAREPNAAADERSTADIAEGAIRPKPSNLNVEQEASPTSPQPNRASSSGRFASPKGRWGTLISLVGIVGISAWVLVGPSSDSRPS